MGSSRSDEWPTDPVFFARLEAELGPFELDPCATPENAKCERYFTREDDGLAQTWTGRVYMNPPYGRTIGQWMRKAWGIAVERRARRLSGAGADGHGVVARLRDARRDPFPSWPAAV